MQFGDFPNTAANYILIETTRANFCCLPSKTLTDKTYLARNFREPIGLAKVMTLGSRVTTLGSRVFPELHCPHPSSSFGCPSCVEILPWLPRTLPQSPVCQQPLRAGPRAEHIRLDLLARVVSSSLRHWEVHKRRPQETGLCPSLCSDPCPSPSLPGPHGQAPGWKDPRTLSLHHP